MDKNKTLIDNSIKLYELLQKETSVSLLPQVEDLKSKILKFLSKTL